jgi:hypothetical protein
LIENIELTVEKANVEEGGTLHGNRGWGMQEEIKFVWLEPPSPKLPQFEGAAACYHGSSEEKFNGKFQEGINNFIWSGLDTKIEAPSHNLSCVEKFVEDNSDLVTAAFCQHVYANCIQKYLIGSLYPYDRRAVEANIVSTKIMRIFILANNLRYRYIPQEACKHDIETISKYGRDIHTERGLARILVNEVNSLCAVEIREKCKKVKKECLCVWVP